MAKKGRPSKYPNIDLVQVESLAALGLIDDEIALALGIAERTLENYKKKPEFLHAIKSGKQKADLNVIKSLYSRATGNFICPHCKGNIIGPSADTTAMIFWLKNRQPDRWRDRHDVGISGEITHRLSITGLKKSLNDFKENGS